MTCRYPSPLLGHLFLCSAELHHVELTQGQLQLLPAALHLLLQLHVEAPQLLVLLLDVYLFTAQLPDSGLQLRVKTGLDDLLIKLKLFRKT